MLKKILAAASILAMMAAFSACGTEQQTLTDEKGEMLKYSIFELTENGFYIHDKEEDTFTPVESGFSDYAGIPREETGFSDVDLSAATGASEEERDRYIWVSDTDYDPVKLIPTVDGKNTELVYFQTSESDMPEYYTLEKYRKIGYTLGVHFTFGESGNRLYLDRKSACCKDSNAEEILKETSEELLLVQRLNQKKKLPLSYVDRDIDILYGLEKDKLYQVGYFDGTQYYSDDILADTLCFKAVSTTTLTSPVVPTEYNYFVVKLPKNLANGFYYINDNGLFRYRTAAAQSK